MADDIPICVIGYPRSGVTWLARLLADVLNSPCGGYWASPRVADVCIDGLFRPGPYRIYKGHWPYSLIRGTLTPGKPMTSSQFVVLVRDPRALVVSAAHFLLRAKINPEVTAGRSMDEICYGIAANMYNGHMWDYVSGVPYQTFVADWLTFDAPWLRYEDLSDDPAEVLADLCNMQGWKFDGDRLRAAIQRQSFVNRQEKARGLMSAHMWKGQVDSWNAELSKTNLEFVEQLFDGTMRRLGYRGHQRMANSA